MKFEEKRRKKAASIMVATVNLSFDPITENDYLLFLSSPSYEDYKEKYIWKPQQ